MKLVAILDPPDPTEPNRVWPPPIRLVSETGEAVEGLSVTDVRFSEKGCSVTFRVQCEARLLADLLGDMEGGDAKCRSQNAASPTT